MKFHSLCTLLFLLLVAAPSFAREETATVREYSQSFTTYPFSDPDPVPHVQGRLGNIYPYFRFDGYTDKPVLKPWKVVELENDYIKLLILPEIGGKVWAAIEKATGKPFLYYNHVVKFRDLSLRGPWTSGGLEPNYGIMGHTPNCCTPVDYLARKNADGSVSCVLGVLDLLTRTPWRLEIRLPKDTAYFLTKSFWYNATPLEQPYYTWMNAAVKTAGKLQLIAPGTAHLGHDGQCSPWHINPSNGKDVAWYDNNNFGSYKSYHVFGKYTDFFGAYWHDEDFGMGHYATHDDKAGKKIWIWGLSPQGMIWQHLLTDADGQYVEVQSGRLFNQSAAESTFTPFKHRGFAPYAADLWTEYWFPVKGTQGFVQAAPCGALNLRRENSGLSVSFCPLEHIDDKLEIYSGKELLYAKQLRLRPLEVFRDEVRGDRPNIRGGNDTSRQTNANRRELGTVPLRVVLGGNKLVYQSDPRADVLARPTATPRDFDWQGVYGLYLQGKEHLRGRRYPAARQKLEECLKKDPHFLPALAEMAQLMYRSLQYQTAEDYALRAMAIDTYDPEANFAHGLACLKLGHLADAKDGFDIATLSAEYRSAAYTELGKIYFREKNLLRAADCAQRGLDYNRFNMDARQLLAVVHHRTDQNEKARAELAALLEIDPLNHFARFEKYLAHEISAGQFTALVQNELPAETYLELAVWYAGLGCFNECDQVLQLAPQTPEIAYWRAYAAERMGSGDAAALLRRAARMSPSMVFPFRAETAAVLQWADQQDTSWKPKYYLALVYWSVDNAARAQELFAACGDQPDYAPFYAARAALFENHVAEDLGRAIRLDRQWRYGLALAKHYLSTGEWELARQTAGQFHREFPNNYYLGMTFARTLFRTGQYQACDELLSHIRLLPNEGDQAGRSLYKENQLMLALQHLREKDWQKALERIAAARTWPENLGAGKPYDEDVDERLEDYLAAACCEQLGRSAEAGKLWAKIVHYPADAKTAISANRLVLALTLKKQGKPSEAENVLKNWLQREPGSQLARWCLDAYHGTVRAEPQREPQENDYENCAVLRNYLLTP